MGVLQDFERRLEGAVEGFFARAFRSGLQPIELAKAVQRYADDHRHVAEDGIVVPNTYRVTIAQKDRERLATYGDQLPSELAEVVERTATERGWVLRGPTRVTVDAGPEVRSGQYEVTGRVEAGPRPASSPPPRAPAPPPAPAPSTSPASAAGDGAATTVLPARGTPTLLGPDGQQVPLRAGRHTIGRLPDCDLHLDDSTVSREHAAVVRRGDRWWVLDLGSTNGTRVNGQTAAEQPLADGDTIELGDVPVIFRAVS
jgi:pSer/pThr/pTyr-binding forkhead associated (FHA) protein